MPIDISSAPRMGDVRASRESLVGRYDDFASFVHDAQRVAPWQDQGAARYHRYWIDKRGGDWYGLPDDADFDLVRAVVFAGWPDGLRKMEAALGQIEVSIPPLSVRRSRLRGDHGDDLDIHRVYSGDLAHAFTSMKRPPGTKRKPLSIVVDSIAYGGRDADSMFWQGAAALKLGELLSNAGYSVELHSAFKAEADCEIDVRVLTKASGAPLDLCSAAATLALPAFFRCIGHAWIHANLKHRYPSEGVNVRKLDEADGDFVAQQSIDDKDDAAEWIADQLARMQRICDGDEEWLNNLAMNT